jgi:hypothetical protein
MFDFLRAIGLQPLEWSQAVAATGEGTPYVGRILDEAFSIAQAVVVLMTPDDEARLRKQFQKDHDEPYENQLTGQARPNVLFEAGMAMGRDERRTVVVQVGNLRPFSDVGGRHVVRLNNSGPKRQELADRLKTAGCIVDLSGTDWHSTGSFDLEENSSSTNSSHAEDDLPPDAVKMLVRFAHAAKSVSLEQASVGINLSKGKRDFYRDQLLKLKYIKVAMGRVGSDLAYFITAEGRSHLNDRNML